MQRAWNAWHATRTSAYPTCSSGSTRGCATSSAAAWLDPGDAEDISLDAQWIKHPTPGLPRLPDGKPDLSAPAPRTAEGKPDFSGLWSNDGGDR